MLYFDFNDINNVMFWCGSFLNIWVVCRKNKTVIFVFISKYMHDLHFVDNSKTTGPKYEVCVPLKLE